MMFLIVCMPYIYYVALKTTGSLRFLPMLKVCSGISSLHVTDIS